MSKQPGVPTSQEIGSELQIQKPFRPEGLKLFRQLLIYHTILAVFIILIITAFPDFVPQLPIGGITEIVESGDISLNLATESPAANQDNEIVSSVINAAYELDRLGYARQLILTLIGVWCLMLPVSWVHKGIHKAAAHDHSLDETTLVLPGIVASIVMVVQHSLALAFSLAGIVAGVQFRRALQDTFDALFILVAIGTGIAAGVKALEIAAVLTIFFSYATLYVYYFGDGLESDYAAHRKALKEMHKKEAAEKKSEH